MAKTLYFKAHIASYIVTSTTFNFIFEKPPFPDRPKQTQISSQLLADRLTDHIRFPSVFLHFSSGDKLAIFKDSEDYSCCFC